MDFEKIGKRRLGLYESKANLYLKDKKKSQGLLKKALRKAAAKRGTLGGTWEKLQLLFGVLRDWLSGNYTEMPKRSLLMIILGILYFVSPIDGVLDYIPFAGLIDDAAVAGFVISQVSADLERYKVWKNRSESQKRSDDEIIDGRSSL